MKGGGEGGKQSQRNQNIQKQLGKERARFTEPLTGKQARHIAASQAGTEYNPVIRGFGAEKRGEVKRQGQLNSDYNQLATEIAGNAQKAGAENAATNSALTARLGQAGAQSAATLGGLAAQDKSTSSLLGGPTNTAGNLQAAAGNAARAQQLIALTAPNTAAGATYANYLRQRGTSARERGIEATQGEVAARRLTAENQRAALKQRGQATVKNLNALRGEERAYQIQRRAFPLEKQAAALKGREAAQGASLAAQKNQREKEAQENENLTTRAGLKGGTAGLTPDEKHTIHKERVEKNEAKRQNWNNARNTARTLYERGASGENAAGKTTYGHEWASEAELISAVENEGVASTVARRAVKQLLAKRKASAKSTPSPPSLGFG